MSKMTERQKGLARHALGLPNKNHTSYRNHFCAGPGHNDWQDWLDLVSKGLARVAPPSTLYGGDSMFHLTLKGARMARERNEHLSLEDTMQMRELEDQ